LSSSYPWQQLANIPIGIKGVKEGASAVATDEDHIYLLGGSNGTGFYRYSISDDTWEVMPSPPLGVSGKPYKTGSCLAYNPVKDTIYLLKGSYNEFYAFGIGADTWVVKDTLPRCKPAVKRIKKKVKDGAGMAYARNVIYTLKGGNTNEFWAYVCSPGYWVNLPDVTFPEIVTKTVKNGGALTYSPANGVLYALKGNNTREFWKYTLEDAERGMPNAEWSEQTAGPAIRNPNSALRIEPNPFSAATEISYSLPQPGVCRVHLYDVTGKLVAKLTDGPVRAGNYTLNLDGRRLGASGMFILTIDAAGYHAERKLILQ
jgi:hypothetical protein